jgi:hypothetical protein
VSATAPDLVTPVVGFRSWRIANGRLQSPYIPCRWEGRVMHAECYDANRVLLLGKGWLDAPHRSPHPDCQCGIYAYHRPGLRAYYGEQWWCEGVVAAWGRIEVHADGLRAEYARVEALGVPDLGNARLNPAVEAIGEQLAVPVIGAAELPAFAERLGGLVPPSLRPATLRPKPSP